MTERYEHIDWGQRWLLDAFDTVPLPGGCCILEIDMSRSLPILTRMRACGLKATPTHLFVRAVALALERHPDLNCMVLRNRRVFYDQVAVSLSVAAETTMAALMVIEDAGKKTLPEIAEEIIERAPQVRDSDSKRREVLRRWGWVVPTALLRRAVLRWLRNLKSYRRNRLGTVQITTLPSVDLIAPFTFGTCAIVGIGKVKDRVVASAGNPVVRPTVSLVCSFNHKAWDGVRAQRFMTEIANILENGQLDAEVTHEHTHQADPARFFEDQPSVRRAASSAD